jgi:hypothetical protein
MYTAGESFTHLINFSGPPKLVTTGIYRWRPACRTARGRRSNPPRSPACSLCRHPSYFGWFWWAVGTQVILANPICLVAYTYVSWRFFDDRIEWVPPLALRAPSRDSSTTETRGQVRGGEPHSHVWRPVSGLQATVRAGWRSDARGFGG